MNDEFITSLVVIQITRENYHVYATAAPIFFDVNASCQGEERDIDAIAAKIRTPYVITEKKLAGTVIHCSSQDDCTRAQ